MFRTIEHYGDSEHLSEPEPLCVRTLEEVGHELGLSRERVRQIEREALQKTRLALRVLELAPAADAWAIVDGLRGATLDDFREAVRRLKLEAVPRHTVASQLVDAP